MLEDYEVIVLGGGPAGCAAALLLARTGHRVAVVRPERPPAGDLAQSVPPSAGRILTELGLVSYLDRAGLQPNGGNTVWWAGGEVRVERFEEGRRGWHVDRAGLEVVLAEAAVDAGATLVAATARSVEPSAAGWTIRLAATARDGAAARASGDNARDVPTVLRAGWVLDATGRHGLLARGEGRVPDRSTSTIALVRRWSRPGGFDDVDPTHTLVESYDDGWAWSVPLGPDVRCFTAMVDHRHVDLGGGDLDAALDAALDRAGRVGAARTGAEPIGPAWACPASLYTSERFGRDGLLLVGDAGSFIDPLSSFGVKKALSSGWLAGIAVNTALSSPSMLETAIGFYDEREREVYRRYRARSAPFFAACADAYGHAYWTERARAAEVAGARAETWGDPDAVDGEGVPAVLARAALERLRALDRVHAVAGSSLRTVRRPTVVGHRIELGSHLASDRMPRGLRYVRNVDLGRVVRVAPEHLQVPDGWVAYNASGPAVALPDYLAALATAFAAGLLEHADGT